MSAAREVPARGAVALRAEGVEVRYGAVTTNRKRVIAALRARADAGAVVVMATHDADAAAELDAELRLEDGRLGWPRPWGGPPDRS